MSHPPHIYLAIWNLLGPRTISCSLNREHTNHGRLTVRLFSFYLILSFSVFIFHSPSIHIYVSIPSFLISTFLSLSHFIPYFSFFLSFFHSFILSLPFSQSHPLLAILFSVTLVEVCRNASYFIKFSSTD